MGFRDRFQTHLTQDPITSYFTSQKSKFSEPISFTGGIWEVRDKFGDKCDSKAIRVKKSSNGGVLMVHAVDDPEDSWEDIDLLGGDDEGIVFDKIRQEGTTIPLDDIKIVV